MSALFNRLKSRKTGYNNVNNTENESTIPTAAFDEEGFLCPLCHQKFNSHTQLAQHYTDAHAQGSVVEKKDTHVTQQEQIQIEDPNREIALWKEQFTGSEESRILLTNELMQEKQRADDFEEELHLLQKHLKTTQAKVAEQSQEIANFKATRDVYDAQLTIFSNELLITQNQLKEKQQQIDTLLAKSTNDDVDVLKCELITIQKRMNEISIEKEQQIEKLHLAFIENYQYIQKLDQIGNIFNQNLVIYDEMISKNTSQIESEINKTKQFVRLTRERKEKIETIIKYLRICLNENQAQLKQTNNDLEQQKQSNDKLINDLQKQTNSSRNQIELLNNEIHQLEKTLNQLKEEKNQLIQTKMDGDQDNERQNLVRQITLEKNQYEQQTKELRLQIKQVNNERQQIQDEFDNISKQCSQISNEKTQLQNEQIRLNNEIDALKKQLDNHNKDKERQMNELKHELSTTRERYTSIENNLREANEYNDNQNRELEKLKNNLKEQINRLEEEKTELQQMINQQEQTTNKTKIELNTIQKEKDSMVQQLQTTLSQLHAKLDQRENRIKRLSFGIHRNIVVAHKIQEYIQQNIHNNQINILATIEKAEQDSRLIRAQTLEEIHEEFTSYLTTTHTIILDSKNKLEKQIENNNLNVIEHQQQLNKLKHEHEKLIKEHHEQKQKLEIQLGEVNNNLLQVSESLSESTQTVDRQREKYEKQITSLERELESRTKRHEMQLGALTENLAAVRSELKSNHEKLANLDQIKAEKADIEARLAVNQDERRSLLERSLAIESKNEKVIAENGQLIKKNTELEAALQEIAREYQVLQIQENKLSQRRWLDDDDVDACMRCNQTFRVTQRKHHCRNCGNIFCDSCSSKTAILPASRKQKRVCEQCYKDLTS